MDKKSRAELVTWDCRRLSEKRMPLHRPEGTDILPCGAASRLVLALLLVSVSLTVGYGKTIAAHCCSGSLYEALGGGWQQ